MLPRGLVKKLMTDDMGRLHLWKGRRARSHMWVCCVPCRLVMNGFATDADLCLESATATELLRRHTGGRHTETPTPRTLPREVVAVSGAGGSVSETLAA